MHALRVIALVCAIVGSQTGTKAVVNIETVPVGDPGNAGDVQHGTGYGSVSYTYNIGKYEVTAGQYCEFLNKVARTDTYALYDGQMADPTWGCGISRTGLEGSHAYVVDAAFVDRPVNFVSYWNTFRFANWLHNGQPAGAQGNGTTETGAYTLAGYNDTAGLTIRRNSGWKWALTSETEWHKAAYYKGGSTNAGYWNYPTGSDVVPGRDLNDPTGNNANYHYQNNDGPYPIDGGKYTTVVGQFRNSPSSYGTFDQGGNVWEWNEDLQYNWLRGMRGGAYDLPPWPMHAQNRGAISATAKVRYLGFRLVEVPDPATLSLVAIAGAGLMARRRRS